MLGTRINRIPRQYKQYCREWMFDLNLFSFAAFSLFLKKLTAHQQQIACQRQERLVLFIPLKGGPDGLDEICQFKLFEVDNNSPEKCYYNVQRKSFRCYRHGIETSFPLPLFLYFLKN
jgi:hypothetical protein